MNKKITSSTPARPRPPAARFSRQEKLILGLVALLGVIVLSLAAYVLLVYLPVSPGQTAAARPEIQMPLPTQPAQALSTAPPAPASLPAGCSQQNRQVVQARVNRVLDDGTLDVQIGQQAAQVRYAGVELLPGAQAAEVVRGLLRGQDVGLIPDTMDRDVEGRLVRYVFSGETFLNLELIRQGIGASQPAGPDQACAGLFQQAELRARADQLGGWKPTPAPTRTFMPFVDISTPSACDCSVRYECGDFSTRAEAQTCYNACNDYSSKLDEDRDGIACEYLP